MRLVPQHSQSLRCRVRRRDGLFGPALTLILTINLLAAEPFTLASARTAAGKANAQALYFLGKRYAKGDGVPQDYARAAEYLHLSTEKGYALAQNDLGAFYAKGLGVKQDYAEAARWYRKAAEKGDALAQCSLGRAYWLGRGVATNMPASLKWLHQAAKQNQPDAMQFLGEIYLNGAPGIKADRRQAFHWFLQAADQERAGALYSLGQLFEAGNGVTRNLGLALNCYRKAAEKGDSLAMMRLSELSLPGSEGEADVIEAFKWLRLAGLHGNGSANHLIIELSMDGRITTQQYDEACRRADDFQRAFGKTPAKQ